MPPMADEKTLEEELRAPPLPCQGCGNGRCNACRINVLVAEVKRLRSERRADPIPNRDRFGREML